MRAAIKKALDLIQEGRDKIVLELPTGYGKTVAGPYLYSTFKSAGLCWKAVHTFPLRTLLHKALKDYVKDHPDIEFTYQDGDVTLRKEGYVKDPYFTGEYVLTTIDSFVHNLFKAPVAELSRVLRGRAIHYHVPFAYIYPSCVFFDEAHVVAQDERGKTAAALKASIESLIEAEVPVVVMSATLGEWKWKFFDDFVFVRLGSANKSDGRLVEVHDEEFERQMGGVKYSVKAIDEGEVLDVAKRELADGRRVLIVVNNICKAVKWFRELSASYNAALIHSQIARGERAKAEDNLGSARVVVGTSAIEAGVDVTFDTLITSADSPESVAQRVGRVCRYGGNCEGRIYVFGEGADRYEAVAEWRLPYKKDSYASLLSDRLDVDRGLLWVLDQLGDLLFVDPGELSRVFRGAGYSFVREGGLVEVSTTPTYTPEGSFAASIDRIRFKVGVLEGGSVREVDKVDSEWLYRWVEEHGEFPTLYAREYQPGLGPRYEC
ncbi:MAG: CRISPR-associated helicase Cas3' [Thermoproteus sp.]